MQVATKCVKTKEQRKWAGCLVRVCVTAVDTNG